MDTEVEEVKAIGKRENLQQKGNIMMKKKELKGRKES